MGPSIRGNMVGLYITVDIA